MFQLRSWLKKAGVAVPSNSVPLIQEDLHNDDEVIIKGTPEGPVEILDCDGKPETGNQQL